MATKSFLKNIVIKDKKSVEKFITALEQAENKYDLETAARLRHGVLPKLEQELEALRKVDSSKILSDTVDEEKSCNKQENRGNNW